MQEPRRFTRLIPRTIAKSQSVLSYLNRLMMKSKTVAACRKYDVPLFSRGGGTSLAGQCCNTAIAIDWSKYLGQILDIDPIHKQATVRPGCVLDNLRNA